MNGYGKGGIKGTTEHKNIPYFENLKLERDYEKMVREKRKGLAKGKKGEKDKSRH